MVINITRTKSAHNVVVVVVVVIIIIIIIIIYCRSQMCELCHRSEVSVS